MLVPAFFALVFMSMHVAAACICTLIYEHAAALLILPAVPLFRRCLSLFIMHVSALTPALPPIDVHQAWLSRMIYNCIYTCNYVYLYICNTEDCYSQRLSCRLLKQDIGCTVLCWFAPNIENALSINSMPTEVIARTCTLWEWPMRRVHIPDCLRVEGSGVC